MPRDGSLTLSDLEAPLLYVACESCGRRGRNAVVRLMAKHGDVKLTDLLLDLARCEKARSLSIHDRCKARYEALASGFKGAIPPRQASPWASLGRGEASGSAVYLARAAIPPCPVQKRRRCSWHRMLTPSEWRASIGGAFLPFEAGEP